MSPEPVTGVMAAVADAKAIADAITAVAKTIATFNEARSVILEIDNNTDCNLIKVAEHHAHGGWAATPLGEIPPQKAMIFGSQSVAWSVGTGTEGYVTYRGLDFDLTASWDNPFIGSNSCDLLISGGSAGHYRANKECGSGNKEAHMRYELYTMTLQMTAPEANATVNGQVNLTAQGSGLAGVAFSAYYATNSGVYQTRAWRNLGVGRQSAPGEWSLSWNSASIPDQGRADWNIVQLRATALDGSGATLGLSDSRRVNVQNGIGSLRVAARLIDATHWRVDARDAQNRPVTNAQVYVNGVLRGNAGQSLTPRPIVHYSQGPRGGRWQRSAPKGVVKAAHYFDQELNLSAVWVDDGPP